MPTSATGRSTDHPRARRVPTGSLGRLMENRPGPSLASGFTLLELLVVVVIVGIIATMFTLGVGTASSTDRELRREAERLATLIRLALEDATFQTRELGLRLYPERYEFSVFDPGRPADPEDDTWRVLTGQDILASREIPPVFQIELEIDGRAVALEKSAEQVRKRYEPQLFLLSSGDVSDTFTIRFRERESGLAWRVAVGADGRPEVAADER